VLITLTSMIMAAAAAMLSSAASRGLSDAQALTILLTVESLTFAAFGLGVAVTTPIPGGRSPYLATGKLARDISIVLTLVAAAAASAWWEVFMEPRAPNGGLAWVQALGVVVVLAAQPYFSWRVAWGARAWR
jgi:hypothetical protein